MKVLVLIFSLFFFAMLTLFINAYGLTLNNVQATELTTLDLNVTTSDIDVIGVSEYSFLNNIITAISGAPVWLNILLGVLYAIDIYVIVATFLGIGG